MDWPNQDDVKKLIDAGGGLTGAEHEVLSEYLSQEINDWEYMHSFELDDEDADDTDADNFPVSALLRRLNEIFQNHQL